MHIPKVYGQSKVSSCPFCGQSANVKNEQGVPVCKNHTKSFIQDVKCACGEYMDIREGKWGPFFLCMNCGPVNWRKGMEMNPQIAQQAAPQKPIPFSQSTHAISPQLSKSLNKAFQPSKKPTVITSDDIDVYY